MSTDLWGNNTEAGSDSYSGLFAIRKSLDGEQAAEFVDKMQFIGIKIAGEEFLLSIDFINEIIMLPNITYVPNSAKYIEGVVNLRGTILPVVNMRKMMGMSRGEATSGTRIIICKEENLNVRAGLLVDNITFVVALLPDEIDSSSPPSAASGHELLSGVSKHGSVVSGVLDLEKILTIAADGKSLTTEEDAA
ncbi:MAG: chemotaxis protein CheW [Proteobacteria bacterium]|nr:chemotaxis protein CheW [Pseudomonadota bacterium]